MAFKYMIGMRVTILVRNRKTPHNGGMVSNLCPPTPASISWDWSFRLGTIGLGLERAPAGLSAEEALLRMGSGGEEMKGARAVGGAGSVEMLLGVKSSGSHLWRILYCTQYGYLLPDRYY